MTNNEIIERLAADLMRFSLRGSSLMWVRGRLRL